MLTKEQNELLCRVGKGTPMGNLMRRYWIPVLFAWELPEPDCDPVAIKVLGEDLVAFRDTAGEVGVLDAYCAHRRVHLFWGRNEDHGIRCVYHGWLFDVNGQCVDMSSEPPGSTLREKVKLKSYPVHEEAGFIWIWMGPAEEKPQFDPPVFFPTPDTRVSIARMIVDAALERRQQLSPVSDFRAEAGRGVSGTVEGKKMILGTARLLKENGVDLGSFQRPVMLAVDGKVDITDLVLQGRGSSVDELRAASERHRTPLVMQCVDDYLAGKRAPLDFVQTHAVGPKASGTAGTVGPKVGPKG